VDLDRFDYQILNLIQHDAALTASDLAGTVPLSASAIQRRLRRLREDGVIEKDIAVVNPATEGDPVTCVVNIRLGSERPDLVEQFRSWLKAAPCIQQVYYVTGDTDYVLVVTAPTTSAFHAFMEQMVADNPNVKRYTTNVVLHALKRGLAIPL